MVKYNNNNYILINKKYDIKSRKILCAHELGHIILHKGNNRFKGDNLEYEYEANLFAVALLFSEEDFSMKFVEMSSFTLQTILELNIK